jgi:predicted nuclease with RNAse H fold
VRIIGSSHLDLRIFDSDTGFNVVEIYPTSSRKTQGEIIKREFFAKFSLAIIWKKIGERILRLGRVIVIGPEYKYARKIE